MPKFNLRDAEELIEEHEEDTQYEFPDEYEHNTAALEVVDNRWGEDSFDLEDLMDIHLIVMTKE